MASPCTEIGGCTTSGPLSLGSILRADINIPSYNCPEPWHSLLCLNGGVCQAEKVGVSNDLNSFYCNCTSGFKGARCIMRDMYDAYEAIRARDTAMLDHSLLIAAIVLLILILVVICAYMFFQLKRKQCCDDVPDAASANESCRRCCHCHPASQGPISSSCCQNNNQLQSGMGALAIGNTQANYTRVPEEDNDYEGGNVIAMNEFNGRRHPDEQLENVDVVSSRRHN